MYALVIHSLLTVASLLIAAYCAWKAEAFVRLVRHAKRQLNAVQDVEDRLQALEKGQDILTQRVHQQIGRHGALVARVNGLGGPQTVEEAEEELVSNADDETRAAEREKLERLLVDKSRH